MAFLAWVVARRRDRPLLTLSVAAISTLPDDFRDRVKFFILIALALFATIEIFRPFDFRAILG